MDIKETERIYTLLRESRFVELANKLIKTGIRYARIRVDWYILPIEDRLNMDTESTHAYNVFISNCDSLARNMAEAGEDNWWRRKLGTNRKVIGDFACWLHMAIGIKAR